MSRASLVGSLTARMILEAGAVQYNGAQPFFLSSGWASPVYLDFQRIISFPRMRSTLMDFASETVLQNAGYEQFDAVAGAESAGIPYAAWIAERLSLPLQSVRRKPRGFGAQAQVQGGRFRAGTRVLLVDDVTTDGRTKAALCHALRAAEARVEHVLVMFYYDVFPEARDLLASLGIRLHYLATWRDILGEARASGYFAPDAAADVQRFIEQPARWSLEHGGIAAFPGGMA
ncbi:MAG TPA: orotate phosphoribosyltransferase [Burkholderiales bacterium]|nr:orotate phosphoribosyltransferase [Burkholderiales bacterium]